MPDSAPDSTDAQALAHVEDVVRRSGTSFFAAMRRLPAAKRNAMYAVYAFCREVDDIADDPGASGDKAAGLGAWRDEIERLYRGQPTRPVARALVAAVRAFGLEKKDFASVIDGMEMDAAPRLRIADMDELGLYCDRVASAVGRLSNRIFGLDHGTGDRVAEALGTALQMTNILRDLKEDAERDRLYLPAALLRAHGITATDTGEVLAHPRLAAVCDHLAAVAERRFVEAGRILAACDRRQVRPAVMMMEAYRRLFRRVLDRGWRHLDRPVGLTRIEKLWVVLRYGIL